MSTYSATIGNTVYLGVTFATLAGVVADPTNITLKIYDENEKVLVTYTIGNTEKVSTGVYQKAYTVPASGSGDLTFKFFGTLEGTPIAAGDTFSRVFV